MGSFNMFSELKTPADLTKYTLFRGTTDFSQLQQFELYESGYPYLVLVSIPRFIEVMAKKDDSVRDLVNSYKAVIEREFLGFDSGLTNIEGETSEISNGVQSVNLITKVNAPSGSTISATYKEKAGAVITKMHELYLRSIRDPNSTFKTYNGMIGFDKDQLHPDSNDVGFHNECFTFLYMHTDNTGLMLERAVLYTCCQPTTAELQIFNGRKGDVQFQEVSVEYNAFPLMGKQIDAQANKILAWMNNKANANYVERNSWNYMFEATNPNLDINKGYGLFQSSLIGKS